MTVAPPRGTRDFLNDDAKQFQHIIDCALDLATRYGYSPAFTPLFENYHVFSRAVGETSDVVTKEMYMLESRGEKKDKLALRPEGTASLARALISNGLTQTLPQKFIYFGPMFRYERPQKGRYRQFQQLGVEHFGAKSPTSDAESILLAARLLQALTIETTLNINTLGSATARQSYTKALVEFLTPKKHDLSPDSQTRLSSNPMRILDSKCSEDHAILAGAPTLRDFLEQEDQDNFGKVLAYLNDRGISYIINDKLVRGLDYYTGTVFEFTSDALGAQSAILAGGRFDQLVKDLGGPVIPAIGWAMGVDRAMLASTIKFDSEPIFAMITVGDLHSDTLKIAEDLRCAKLNVVTVEQNSISKAMKQADRMGADFALIYGEDEHKKACVTFKTIHGDDAAPKESCIDLNKLSEFCHEISKNA